MPVLFTPTPRLRVVEVHADEVLESDCRVEFVHCVIVSLDLNCGNPRRKEGRKGGRDTYWSLCKAFEGARTGAAEGAGREFVSTTSLKGNEGG